MVHPRSCDDPQSQRFPVVLGGARTDSDQEPTPIGAPLCLVRRRSSSLLLRESSTTRSQSRLEGSPAREGAAGSRTRPGAPARRSSPSASREHWKVLPERRLGAFGREASGEQGVGDKAENDQTRDHKPVADATHNPQTPRTFPSGLCASGSNGEGHGWVSSVRAFATAVQRQDVRPSTWL